MKRFFTILFFALAFSNFAIAQLPDGAVGPDFTATDLDGVEHNLYDLLDAGKSVVLDISATWCPPCWDYHNETALKDIWNNYGPDGTDEMYVFMIEGDDDTTLADLQGTGDDTLGDWITGTPYPIIDDGPLATEDYAINFFPTLYHICPNKTVTRTGQASAAAFYAAHNSCVLWANNVRATNYTGGDNICGSATAITPKVELLNLGTENMTSCTVEFLMDGNSVQTIDWTGDLANLETGEASFDDVEVLNSADFSFVVSSPNGGADESESDNVFVQTIGTTNTASATFDFAITTDFWPEEISWELKDGNGTVLFSNADLGALNCDESYTQSYDLTVGDCYSFSIEDTWGDGILNGAIDPTTHSCGTANGMASQAMGAFSVSSASGVLWDDIAYGSGFAFDFIAAAASATQEVEFNTLDIYPNPATDNVTVAFDIAKSTNMEVAVYNVYGQQVTTTGNNQYVAGSNTVNVNTASLATGIYFISISEGDKVTSRKISILK